MTTGIKLTKSSCLMIACFPNTLLVAVCNSGFELLLIHVANAP